MVQKYSHQLAAGFSFGLTSGVLTALGIFIGMYSATDSKLAVVAGLVVLAIADGLSDAAAMHVVEESEVEEGKSKHTPKEIWITTFCTFLAKVVVTLTFAIPVFLFPLGTAVPVSVAWGIILLIVLNFYVAKTKKESPIKIICEHVLLAIIVVIISYWIGNLIATVA